MTAEDRDALIIAVRAEAKADTAHELIKEVMSSVSTKIDTMFFTLDKKFDLLRTENTQQHAEANRSREKQVGEVKDLVTSLYTTVAVNNESQIAYTDTKVGATDSRINKLVWWALGMLGTGAGAGVGLDKIIGL